LLEECFDVIRAWGFKYKTSFVWDKVKHNMGHYNSVRHELLLVCTKGSCTPDVPKLFDSVVSVERTAKHSEKPEVFREMIDTLYTTGRKIELFARKMTPGWETWGNQL
jgi:N6-adenosine-specific RNA methylase IME4